jgi:cell division protein FtsW
MSAVISNIASSMSPYGRSGTRSRTLQTDAILIMVVAAILLISAVMVTSASISIASKETGDAFYYLKRQLIFIALGSIACMISTRIPTRLWERLHVPLLLAGMVMLIIVLIPGIGVTVNGSRRWIRLGFMNFQVSELARVCVLAYMAGYIVHRQKELKESFKATAVPLGVLAVVAALLLREPDFGATAVLLATSVALLFLGGMRLRYFFILVAGAAALMAVIAFAAPYRMKRLVGCIDPWADPFGSCYQLVQSEIAIGRGEWFGVGLGSSVQKLFYLPEAHTDFVFAVIAEEFGFIGVLLLLTLYGVVVWRVLRIARMAAEASMPFQAFIAAAFGIWMGLQTFINIGVNMGILPTKGLTLPMLSNGGSSLLVALAWLGVVLRIHHEASLSGRAAMPRSSSTASGKVKA